jgi:N-acetylmuramoyl-L-alanine amidase
VRRLPLVVVSTALLVASCTSSAADGPGGDVVTPVPLPTTSAPSSTVSTPSKRPTHKPSTSAVRSSSSVVVPSVTATAPAGLTVVLNPGHNGGNTAHPDEISRQVPAGYGTYKDCDTTGTETDNGYPEHAFNWDVALRVRKVLRAHGVRVVMTRPDDSGVGPCVDERAAIGNRPGVAAVVSIHADGAPASGHGFHVNQDSRRPDGATAATARRSIALGRAIHDALERTSGLVPSTYIGEDGYYYRSDLAGLNLATKPATFLELGNMKNLGDAALQSSASGRARIAAAIAAGILAFLGR